MPTLDYQSAYASPPIRQKVPTGIDRDIPITPGRKWQYIIDELLMPWLRDPTQLQDDGVTPPTPTILRLAMDVAEEYRRQHVSAPTSVVADPNGGVVFEWRSGADSEIVTIWEDGLIEYTRFESARLVDRSPLSL